jgi:hypothetical protein
LIDFGLVIPDYVQMLWYIRAPTAVELDELRDRVKNCFQSVHRVLGDIVLIVCRGAALASGCKVKIGEHPANLDLRQNSVLGMATVLLMKETELRCY